MPGAGGHPSKTEVTVSSLQQLLVEAARQRQWAGLRCTQGHRGACCLPQGSLEWGTGRGLAKPSGTWVLCRGPEEPSSQEGVPPDPY